MLTKEEIAEFLINVIDQDSLDIQLAPKQTWNRASSRIGADADVDRAGRRRF
jgi:hypothetical protein